MGSTHIEDEGLAAQEVNKNDGSSGCPPFSPDASRSLFHLATSLSIEPSRLYKYVMGLRRCASHTCGSVEAREGLAGPGDDVSDPLLSGGEANAGKREEERVPVSGESIVLQAIVNVLMFPFRSRVTGTADLPSKGLPSSTSTAKKAVTSAAASAFIPPCPSNPSTGKNKSGSVRGSWGARMNPGKKMMPGNSSAPSLEVVSLEATSCKTGVKDSQTCSTSTSVGSSRSVSTSSSSQEGQMRGEPSNEESALLLLADDESGELPPLPFDTADSAVLSRSSSCVQKRKARLPGRTETSTLLEELVEPGIRAGRNLLASECGSGGVCAVPDVEQCMQLFPKELRTTEGIARLTKMYPPFALLLLEAFVKESGYRCSMCPVVRVVTCRLVELVAPVILLQRSCQDTATGIDAVGEGEGTISQNNTCNVTVPWAQRLLATTTISLIKTLDDSPWCLTLFSFLVQLQLVEPGELGPVLHRHASELSKLPQQWTQEVALAYCVVTYEGLKPTAAEEESTFTSLMNNHNKYSLEEEEPKILQLWQLKDCYKNIEEDVINFDSTPDRSEGNNDTLAMLFDNLVAATEKGVLDISLDTRVLSHRTASSSEVHSPTCGDGHRKNETDATTTSDIQWNFPEKVPAELTLSVGTVMTCMILCAGTQSARTVVTLSQWLLRCLRVLPTIPCAVALTHMMLKYPHVLRDESFRLGSTERSSRKSAANSNGARSPTSPRQAATTNHSGGDNNHRSNDSPRGVVPFRNSVVEIGCRLALEALQKQARTLASQHFLQTCGQTRGSRNAQMSPGSVLYELQDVQCYLFMILQALALRYTTPLLAEVQDMIALLFVTSARLRVSVADITTNEEGCLVTRRILQLVDESFRASVCIIDLLVHDYSVEYPRSLCRKLAYLLLPQNTLFEDLHRIGAWAQHADYLETVKAAAETCFTAARSGVTKVQGNLDSWKKKEVQVEGNFRDSASLSARSAGNAYPPHLLPITVQERVCCVEKADNSGCSSPADKEALPSSLAGLLPSSRGPFCFSATQYGGGLTARQKQWWTRRMIVYFVEQWWCQRAGVQVEMPLVRATPHDKLNESATRDVELLNSVSMKSFFQCATELI